VLLALAILFLWLGAALLFVAFHPLGGDDLTGKPGDVITSLQAGINKAGG
jgi:hypothetical protein